MDPNPKCYHANWTIFGTEPKDVNRTMVTCLDCGGKITLREALIRLNERVVRLEKVSLI